MRYPLGYATIDAERQAPLTSEGGNVFEVEENKMAKHVGHDVAIREDAEGFITLECDDCGEYIAE